MITIKRFVCNMLQENCYVVSDDTRQAVIIDCGAYFEAEHKAIVEYIGSERLTPCHLIATHAHFDHCLGNGAMARRYGLTPRVPKGDEDMTDLNRQMMSMTGTALPGTDDSTYYAVYGDDDTFEFGTHRLTAIHTPGHSPGSCCLYCREESTLFAGDTLFRMSIGRTDFEGGSWTDMQKSLARLSELPADTIVLPGHGPQTTIADERQFNPYMCR